MLSMATKKIAAGFTAAIFDQFIFWIKSRNIILH
jgi:hypothetical protein